MKTLQLSLSTMPGSAANPHRATCSHGPGMAGRTLGRALTHKSVCRAKCFTPTPAAGVLSLNSVLSPPGCPCPALALLPAMALNSRAVLASELTVSPWTAPAGSAQVLAALFCPSFRGQSIGGCDAEGTPRTTRATPCPCTPKQEGRGCQAGLCLPSPSPRPREEPRSRASGILQKQSQAPFEAGAGAAEPRWALAACASARSLIGRQLVM